MRYVAAFCKGPAYAERLRTKMKNVETSSEAMEDQASQREQLTLKMIKDVTLQSILIIYFPHKVKSNGSFQPMIRWES